MVTTEEEKDEKSRRTTSKRKRRTRRKEKISHSLSNRFDSFSQTFWVIHINDETLEPFHALSIKPQNNYNKSLIPSHCNFYQYPFQNDKHYKHYFCSQLEKRKESCREKKDKQGNAVTKYRKTDANLKNSIEGKGLGKVKEGTFATWGDITNPLPSIIPVFVLTTEQGR